MTLSQPLPQPSDRTNLPTHTGTAVVSTEGAVISTGAAEVVIPRGALAEPVEIVVQAAEAGFGEIPNADEEQVLAFLPHGTQFLKPVTIHIPHDHISIEGLSLFTSEPDQPWSNVEGATFTEEYAAADVTHFSFFFASPTPKEEIVGVDQGAGGAGGSGGAISTAGSGGSDAANGGTGGTDSVGNGGTDSVGDGNGGTGGTDSVGDGNGGTGGTDSVASGGTGGSSGEGGGAGDTSVAGSAGQGGSTSVPEPRPDAGVAGSGSVGEGGAAGEGGGAGSGSTGGAGGATGGDGSEDYLDSGEWRGHLYSLADDEGSTIDRSGICVEGVVNPGFSTFALWGWNVNQEEGSEIVGSWDPNTESVRYDLSAFLGEPLRLQLIDDNQVTYCYQLQNDFGEVPLGDFNTNCWDNSGTSYDGSTPLVGVQVLVPGNPVEEQPFDFCVYDFTPVSAHVAPGGPDAGAGGSAGGASTGGAGGLGGAGGSSGIGGGPVDGGAGASSGGAAGVGGGPGGPGGGDLDYLDNGEWHGPLYSGTEGGQSIIDRTGICAQGLVAEGEATFALWGWNVNQQEGSEDIGSWDPNAQSVRYDVISSGEPLRLQLIDDNQVTYCYQLQNDFGEVLLTDFSTNCWDDTGTSYDGSTPLLGVQVLVPGNLESEQPFDFCVYDFTPVVAHVGPGGGPDAGAGGSAGGASTGGVGGLGAGGSSGVGGAPPDGGAGASSGGAAGGGPGGGGDIDYQDNGEWRGHLYTVNDPESLIDRTGICAQGLVAEGESSFALWGWNVNQQEGSQDIASWDPNAQSVRYDLSSSGEPLRLQLVDDQGVVYCYQLHDESGEVPLTAFNTTCWDNNGAFYDGSTPLVGVQVLVPGNLEEEQPFDFCVYDFTPVVAHVGPGGGGSAGAGAVGSDAGPGGDPEVGGAAGTGGASGGPPDAGAGSAGSPG